MSAHRQNHNCNRSFRRGLSCFWENGAFRLGRTVFPKSARCQRLASHALVKRRIAIAVALVLFHFPIGLFAGSVDRLILFPTRHRIDAHGASQATVPFENGQLEIWKARSQVMGQSGEPSFYVLRFYGTADRADRWVALEKDMWNGRAVEMWGVNYPGFGASSGPTTLGRAAASGLAAFDAMKVTAGKKPIILFGASFGTAVALHVAAERQVAGVILLNPPPLRQLILGSFGWWNLWLLAGPVARQIPSELDSVANANQVHAPAVFLLAKTDELVAPRFQRLVADAYAGEKRVLLLPVAHHTSVLEGGSIMADVYKAYDWLLDRRH